VNASQPDRRAWIPCRTAAFLVLLAVLAALAGCATTDDDVLPWNTPQDWEGHPTIPGMSPY
jgi:hypothetical protein